MKLVRRLADEVLEQHPNRAAMILERLGQQETARLLARGAAASAAALLQRLSPQFGADVVALLDPGRAARILDLIPLDTAARLMRRVEQAPRSALLEQLDARRARNLRRMLEFPEGSAGALMDPDVLVLPQDLSAREALQRVRQAADQARYNLYVVDQSQRLVGVLNLRELLLARPGAPLSDLMSRDPYSIPASADRASVLGHPGWKEVHSLPVVDTDGGYLGAIRYRTLRELEAELLAPRAGDEDASAAFGNLIAAGAGGLLDALAGGSRQGGGSSHGA